MCTETHKLACDKLQGFLSRKCLITEAEVTSASHLATTVDSEENAHEGESSLPGCSRGVSREIEYTGFITHGLCFPLEVLMPSSSLLHIFHCITCVSREQRHSGSQVV